MINSLQEKPLNGATQPFTTVNIHEQPSLPSEKQEHLPSASLSNDFDPCAIAKPCSPFYLYRHESPKPSVEHSRLKSHDSTIHVSIYDLEAGSRSTSISQEKRKHSNKNLFRPWPSSKQGMTKPKEGVRDHFQKLPPWQRLSIKLLIAIFIIGAVVGVAVGVSIKVHGGIYKSANEQATIPS